MPKDKGKKRFDYGKRSKEQLEKRARQFGGLKDGFISDDVKVFTPQKNDNILRILPPTWDGAEHWGYDVWVHYGIGPDNSAYLCLEKMKGEPCALCDERKRAQKAKDSTEDYVNKLEPTKRVLMFILDRKNMDEGRGQPHAQGGVDFVRDTHEGTEPEKLHEHHIVDQCGP